MDISILNRFDINFFIELLRTGKNTIYSNYEDYSIIAEKIINNKGYIEDLNWFYPFQSKITDAPNEDNVICFLAKGVVVSESRYNYLISGYIYFEKIDETEVVINSNLPRSIIITNAIYRSSDINVVYSLIYEELKNDLNFASLNKMNNFYLEQIHSIEDLESIDLCTDENYLEKIRLLCLLVNNKTERVWGEYSLVSQITKQPVLMNKATSISLNSMDEVFELIDDLNTKYSKRLKLVDARNKVKLMFSTDLRGHAENRNFQIVLSKLGDWRFGYDFKWCAETIFHEFAHCLDFGRGIVVSGKYDIHKHDFVEILDAILLDYKDWILSRYTPEKQREQILSNNEKIALFYKNKSQIERQLYTQEKEQKKEASEKRKNIYEEIGMNENSFPLWYLLKEEPKMKIDFIEFALKNNKNIKPISSSIRNKILEKLKNSEKPILDKEEMLLVQSSLLGAKNSYSNSLDFVTQLKSLKIIPPFINELEDLSNGKIKSLEEENKFRVRSYEESDDLSTRGISD